MGIPKSKKPRSDAERRLKQAAKTVRVLRVHQLTRQYGKVSDKDARLFASELKVSVRTFYRDVAILKQVYAVLGSNSLD
jgi:predicted DNA-binding transcriptional regulator YafY